MCARGLAWVVFGFFVGGLGCEGMQENSCLEFEPCCHIAAVR